jgi:outer membrane protein W
MKKSIIVASLLLASSCLVAQDSMKDWFVGAEIGGMNVNTKSSVSASGPGGTVSDSVDDSYKPTYEAIKFGRYYDSGRVYGFYAHQNKKEDVTANTFGVGYDYLFKNFEKVVPFIGVQAMYTKAKIDGLTDTVVAGIGTLNTSQLDSPSGFGFGIGAGIIYPVANNFEIEAGVRYVKANIEDDISQSFAGGVSANVKFELEDYTQYYIGVNYRF